MSGFALAVWAWEETGQATTLTLWGFFDLLPRIIITPFAGVIVDRFHRKYLMMVGDTVAVLTTIALLWLFVTNNLQIWHLYLTAVIAGAFVQIQELAYSASISLMVQEQQYVRVSSMRALSGRIAQILAPPLAGFLYYIIGFAGLALIDIISFAVAIATLTLVFIPQPELDFPSSHLLRNFWQDLQFGWRYILRDFQMLALLIVTTLFWLSHDIGNYLYTPMILSRTNNDAQVLGTLAAAAGLGGTTGAIIMSLWGGPKRRIDGVLRGMLGAGVSKVVFGLGRVPQVWIPAQFCSSLNFPFLGSCDTAIWMSQVEPSMQGRVFATQSLMFQIVGAVATLIAGPLADRIFEPLMMSQSRIANVLSHVVGSAPGAGIAILYIISSVGLIAIGLAGYVLPGLQAVLVRSNTKK
ncbi:MFS transporter [Chlorogloeopsis sp. ULAP01]|uniref:MFS transporter n=1 Tax=Chlorogloeopsis sp. ULAP01 TaxID=3056483 RepID=UPI0025AA5AEF|nr:MFS transporter [Chlorogloeopsis sp. ULAP01]MDM9382059.1 MFS transporter [Chlorogloeopsis sp. ULAP01]